MAVRRHDARAAEGCAVLSDDVALTYKLLQIFFAGVALDLRRWDRNVAPERMNW